MTATLLIAFLFEPSSRLRDGLAGALNHDVVFRGGIRYVRVLVSPFAEPARTIGLIAYELQHVVEIERCSYRAIG